jgi:hypothetical protein
MAHAFASAVSLERDGARGAVNSKAQQRSAEADRDGAPRRARSRRLALALGLLAFAMYVGFMLLQLMHRRHG